MTTRFVAAMLMLLAGSILVTELHAETVFVKYQGPVALDRFVCSVPESSFVHRICYRAERQYLVVLLQQTYYHYCRVPPTVLRAWLAAPSAGRFYNAQIKGSFDCRQGGIPSD